jgi:hypothetical protein
MLTQDQVQKAKQVGNEWEAHGHHRIYFGNLESRLGLSLSYYNTGNISGATINGDLISNSEARRILGRLAGAKVFYDCKSDRFVIQYGSLWPEEKEAILNSIKSELE